MEMELPDIPAEERTPLVESFLAIIRVQQERIQQLEETVQQLRDEIGRPAVESIGNSWEVASP